MSWNIIEKTFCWQCCFTPDLMHPFLGMYDGLEHSIYVDFWYRRRRYESPRCQKVFQWYSMTNIAIYIINKSMATILWRYQTCVRCGVYVTDMHSTHTNWADLTCSLPVLIATIPVSLFVLLIDPPFSPAWGSWAPGGGTATPPAGAWRDVVFCAAAAGTRPSRRRWWSGATAGSSGAAMWSATSAP